MKNNSHFSFLKSYFSTFNFQLSTPSGFTYIELILYMALVTMAIMTLVPFAWNVIGGSEKSSSEQEVFSQARSISERIKWEIRNATNINPPVNPTSISLQTSNPATNPTLIDLTGGNIRIKQGADIYYNLNSNTVTITVPSGSTFFTNYTSTDNKTKNIRFIFTVNDSYTGARQEYNVPVVTVQSSAEVRSN